MALTDAERAVLQQRTGRTAVEQLAQLSARTKIAASTIALFVLTGADDILTAAQEARLLVALPEFEMPPPPEREG